MSNAQNENRYVGLLIAIIAIVGGIFYFESQKPMRAASDGSTEVVAPPVSMNAEEKAQQYPRAREIVQPSGFLNSEPFALADFIGKNVILVDFWTYSCINCQRTLPYLTAWDAKYRDKGLVIVGMHSPEFEFEKERENVSRAIEKFKIKYPVVQDNDFATWRAYGNKYWPTKYLIDIDGFIVYKHIGEKAYAETERKIQELLAERAAALGSGELIYGGVTEPNDGGEVDFGGVKSPEIYFGSARNTYLGNGESNREGMQTFTEPTGLKTNILYLAGDWDFKPEYAESASAGAKIIFRYDAKDVYMVASAENPLRIHALRDGKPLGSAAGEDVKNGRATVSDERLYKLVQDTDYGEHTLELIIENPGLRAFTFTFG